LKEIPSSNVELVMDFSQSVKTFLRVCIYGFSGIQSFRQHWEKSVIFMMQLWKNDAVMIETASLSKHKNR
jgi:hypothetical protein